MKTDDLIPGKHSTIEDDSDDSSIHGDHGDYDVGGEESPAIISEEDENEDEYLLEGIIFESGSNTSSNFECSDTDENCSDEEERKSSSVPKANGMELASDSVDANKGESNPEDKTKGPSTSKDKENNIEDEDGNSSDSEVEAKMEDIFLNRPNMETQRNHPPNFKTDSPIFDLCFHPEADLLALGSIDGDCIIYRYSKEKVEEVNKFSHHTNSCRQVCYNCDGTKLYSVSKDKSMVIIDTNESTVLRHMKNIHEAPIYSFYEVDSNVVVTGDDDGMVKFWDLRNDDPVFEFRCGDMSITSMLTCENNRFLSATVADGSLTGFNLRMMREEAQSEMNDSEYTCQALVRSDSRLVVGTGTGAIQIYKWGSFGLPIDGFKGHPDLVQCMASITDNIIITGCEDGNIRAVHIYDHRFLGIVGQHKDFGVENIAVSSDGNILASCSMDEEIQFWDIEYLYKKRTNKKKTKKSDVSRYLVSSRKRNTNEFFRDLPVTIESDDDEKGPVPSTSYDSD